MKIILVSLLLFFCNFAMHEKCQLFEELIDWPSHEIQELQTQSDKQIIEKMVQIKDDKSENSHEKLVLNIFKKMNQPIRMCCDRGERSLWLHISRSHQSELKKYHTNSQIKGKISTRYNWIEIFNDPVIGKTYYHCVRCDKFFFRSNTVYSHRECL